MFRRRRREPTKQLSLIEGARDLYVRGDFTLEQFEKAVETYLEKGPLGYATPMWLLNERLKQQYCGPIRDLAPCKSVYSEGNGDLGRS